MAQRRVSRPSSRRKLLVSVVEELGRCAPTCRQLAVTRSRCGLSQALGLDDAHLERRRRRGGIECRTAADAARICHSGSLFEVQCLPPIVVPIAAGGFGQWMQQQSALVRIAGQHARADELEVLTRRRRSGGGALGSGSLRRRSQAMTGDTARVAVALRGQNRLDTRFEEIEIERGRGGRLRDSRYADDAVDTANRRL